jgi:hypothetical protein
MYYWTEKKNNSGEGQGIRFMLCKYIYMAVDRLQASWQGGNDIKLYFLSMVNKDRFKQLGMHVQTDNPTAEIQENE